MHNIYKITNLKNNKIYIGQTINSIEFRFKQHLREHRGNNQMYKDMENQCKEDFVIELLDRAETKEESDEKERYWITYYDSTNPNKGYNLDSGGKNGNKKSLEGKKIMKQTVINNWEDEDISRRMRDGLTKATEKWIEKCKNNLVECKCPICGEITLRIPSLSNEIVTCGKKECVNEYFKEQRMKNIAQANIKNKEIYDNKKYKIISITLAWAMKNKEIIEKCPKNKIVTTLSNLIDVVYKECGVKDIRSISKACIDSNSKIKFLEWLKENI